MDLKDLMILANNLRQERLLVNSEQQAIQKLNEHVAKDCVQVYQCSWIKCQQRVNLNKLTIARSNYSPASCCQKANALASTKFVDAQKVLKYQDVQAYGEFLQFLRCNPELIATCLIAGDQVAPDLVQSVCCSLVTGLYGTCLSTEDTEYVLQVLKCLMEMQLMLSEDPRRMLRNGSCAFSRLYLMFHEVLFSAKLFLSASLKEPVMQLLMEEEVYLDMDPDLALGRNPDDEMLKKLGREGHRKWTIDTLVILVNHFIKSLREHWILFPNCIARLVYQMVAMLRKQNFADEKINAMCTDLIFTHLICPAIVCPERYSIVDAPVSAVQQFNLVQVGQIIQMLALGKNDGEVKYRELYCRFEKNCVSSLLEPLIETSGKVCNKTHELTNDVPRLNRSSLMFTLQELNTFVSYFQLVVDQSSVEGSNRLDSAYKTQLSRLLATLPISNCDTNKANNPSPMESPKKSGSSLLGSKGSKSRLSRYNSSDVNNTSPTENQISASSSSTNLNNGSATIDASASNAGLTLSNQNTSNSSSTTNFCFLLSDDNRNIVQDVLMIPLPGSICGGEIIQLMSEQEVLALELPTHEHHMQNNLFSTQSRLNRLNTVDGIILSNNIGMDQPNSTSRGSGVVGIEKRTRFSLSHEEGSLGNASDNIEVVSEAASNHSVASSLELEHEDQNDNLSDMTSANVSGRGSPNISGRDTPSSQVTEGGGNNPNNNQNGGPNQNGAGGSNQNGGGNNGGPGINGGDSRPNNKFHGGGGAGGAKILKQARNNDIQDKFCKFEIKKLLEGDETVSIISDTWSTDVLASDSEAVETSYERSYSGARNQHQQQLPVLLERNNRIVLAPPISDRDRDRDRERQPTDVASDAASESAWSTDVLASDSERTTEIDTDDCHSVARSDTDTARSEVDIDNIIENQATNQNLPRRYPSPLSPLVNISPIYAPQALRRDINVAENSNIESPLSDGGVQLRTRNSSASSIGSNRPSGVNGLSSVLSSNPLNSTLNAFDSDSPFYNKHEPQPHHSNTNSNIRFNPRNSITNNDVFHSMNSPFVSAMASTARANGYMDGYHIRQDYENDRKFSDDITDSINNDRSLFRPIQQDDVSSRDQDLQGGALMQDDRIIQDGEIIQDGGNIRLVETMEDGLSQNFNVTGRGGSVSEYRRRTMEYVDSNANNQGLTPHSPGSNEDILNVDPLEKTSGYASSVRTDFSSQEGNVLSNLVSRISIVSERRVTVKNEGIIAKPGASTGAIPKSISFDSTADKYHHQHRDFDVRRGMGNMFNKLKQGFKSRRGKGGRNDAERYEEFDNVRINRRQMVGVDDLETNDTRPVVNNHDTTEDILAKYRRKISSSSEAATSGASDSTGSGSSCSKKNNSRHNENASMEAILDKQRMRNSIQAMEPSSCNYEDAKHKLRLVLSNVDLQSVDFNTSWPLSENTLSTFLRILLSESHNTNLDDNSLSVQLYETMRSIEQLSRSAGLNGILDLCRDLQFEYQSRSLYVQYLINTKRLLLQTLAYLERILNRLHSEQSACDEHLLRVGVRAFLENREQDMTTFCEDFCALRLSDEKIDLLETFLRSMHTDMLKDVNWQTASEEQLIAASLCIERIVMSRVYLNALYPNGEGDIARDNVLHAHMERLSRVVTVSHRDLRIPIRHQREAPWPRSQALLRQMSAYRAARDKARCVARCVTSVMHVLAMTSPRANPSADDLVPVLVFILIKANPPSLLSTVEYVNSFYGNCLQGAEHYWWIQFCSAIEFIKTMDDN